MNSGGYIEDFIFYDDTINIGYHAPLLSTLRETVESVINMSVYTTQIFIGNPYKAARRTFSEDDITATKQLLEKFPTNVFSHAPFIHNLCGLKKIKDQSQQTQYLASVVNSVYIELETMAKIGGAGVVLHIGSCKNKEVGIQSVIRTINNILGMKSKFKRRLLLENSAGEGDKLGSTIQELKKIYDGVDNKDELGFCLDTAHIHGQGDYDLTQLSEFKRLMTDFNSSIGIDKLWLVHLNDCKVDLGSKKDRHESMFRGTIWNENQDVCISILMILNRMKIPVVLETPTALFDTILLLDMLNLDLFKFE